MEMVKSIIWVAMAAVSALIAVIVVTATVGGAFMTILIAGFVGGISGVYLFEFVDVEVSLGNKYADQFVIALGGALIFAFVASFVGGDVIGLE